MINLRMMKQFSTYVSSLLAPTLRRFHAPLPTLKNLGSKPAVPKLFLITYQWWVP